MDDELERPTHEVNAVDVNDETALSEDEDDGGPDWTRFSAMTTSKPYIPKRGDKEHEPLGGTSFNSGASGSSLQRYKLEKVRAAMFGAIDVDRITSSKSLSHSIWLPQKSCARVLRSRGNFLNTMGHTATTDDRCHDSSRTSQRSEKTVELLPEEALYLIERGSMMCWLRLDNAKEDFTGTPMSVQQAYAQMIGQDSLSLEKFQVYAYLKRLGYTVIRATDRRRSDSTLSQNHASFYFMSLYRICHLLLTPLLWFFRTSQAHDWWVPLGFGTIHRFKSQSSIYSRMRCLRAGFKETLTRDSFAEAQDQCSPYKIVYHVYKPPTPFRKSEPPPPDFYMAVIDARRTGMPTLSELSDLFDAVPELPPPKPREKSKSLPYRQPNLTMQKTSKTGVDGGKSEGVDRSILGVVTSWWRSPFGFWRRREDTPVAARRPNAFQMLKSGKKMVVIAAVDCGVISFYRFGQGGFEEWPMS